MIVIDSLFLLMVSLLLDGYIALSFNLLSFYSIRFLFEHVLTQLTSNGNESIQFKLKYFNLRIQSFLIDRIQIQILLVDISMISVNMGKRISNRGY